MSHYIETCTECGAIISQCRCPSKDKEQRHGICQKCEARKRPKLTDQPTDAGKDRETATAQREDIEERMGMSGLSHQQIVEALAARVSGDYYGSHVYLLASSQKSVVEWLLLALAAARREGQAQERQLLKDALMYLGSARQMLADTDMPGTPWWDGLTKMIAAIRACGEEPSR